MASTRTPDEMRALEDRTLVRTLKMKLARSGYSDDMYGTKRMLRMSKDIGILRPEQQKALIRLARTDPREAAECERLYVLTNLPMALKMSKEHAWREGYQLNEEDFLQYAMLGLHDAFKSYNFDAGAIPSVHNWNKIRGRLSHAGRALGWMLLDPKSASELHDRVRKAQRDLENEDIPATPAAIAAKLKDKDVDEARVREVLQMQSVHAVNLDRNMAEGDTAVGETIADERAAFADSVVDDQFSQAVKDAITADAASPCVCCPDRGVGGQCRNALNELEQYLVIAYHDLEGDGEVEQNELFDGVYEDASGRWYSSEDSVINDREARLARDPADKLGGMVTKQAQGELTRRFDAGELTFIAGNDRAQRVFELLGNKPPTQARVQAPLQTGYEKLRTKLSSGAADLSEQYRSRGRNAIEHSGSAEQEVRDALIALARQHGGTLMPPNFDPVSIAKIERMKAGRVTQDGSVNVKSQLREYGEAYGLIDIDTGALKEDVIRHVLSSDEGAPAPADVQEQLATAAQTARKTPKPVMSDIFDRGLIPGGRLIGAYKGVPCEAVYDRASGKFLVFSEGKKVGEAETPSVASKLVSKEENGYNFWAVERGDGKRTKLRDLRNQTAQMMLAEQTEEPVLAGAAV